MKATFDFHIIYIKNILKDIKNCKNEKIYGNFCWNYIKNILPANKPLFSSSKKIYKKYFYDKNNSDEKLDNIYKSICVYLNKSKESNFQDILELIDNYAGYDYYKYNWECKW